MSRTPLQLVLALLALVVLTSGCRARPYHPDQATRAYPFDLRSDEAADMQVFRKGRHIEIYNASARSYHDFDVWINQRFVRRVESLRAGASVRLALVEFRDQYGEGPIPGGILTAEEPTPVILVEIQPSEGEPLIGLVTIRAEPVRPR